MKKIRSIALQGSIVFFSLGLTTSFTSNAPKDVYICKGKYSKKYHLVKKCRGLSNCSTKIEEVQLSEAKTLRRTLCGWED